MTVVMTVGLVSLVRAEPMKSDQQTTEMSSEIVLVPNQGREHVPVTLVLPGDNREIVEKSPLVKDLVARLGEQNLRPKRADDQQRNYLGSCLVIVEAVVVEVKGSSETVPIVLDVTCFSFPMWPDDVISLGNAQLPITVEKTIEILGRFLEMHQKQLKQVSVIKMT
ncbi:MAG: hypothetical protein WA082_02420 [Candidatus Moraniibacteriota bacterium]